MTAREQLVAYLSTLAALVMVFSIPFYAAGHGVDVTEAFAIGTVTGGLIGLLRLPSSRSVTVDNSRDDPAQTTDAKL